MTQNLSNVVSGIVPFYLVFFFFFFDTLVYVNDF